MAASLGTWGSYLLGSLSLVSPFSVTLCPYSDPWTTTAGPLLRGPYWEGRKEKGSKKGGDAGGLGIRSRPSPRRQVALVTGSKRHHVKFPALAAVLPAAHYPKLVELCTVDEGQRNVLLCLTPPHGCEAGHSLTWSHFSAQEKPGFW